jgi:hypothetical protein
MARLGVPRYGLSEDPAELELRISRLETILTARQSSNIQSGAQGKLRSRLPVAQVTGIRLDSNIVGGTGILWNPVPNPDLDHYEILYSTNEKFTGGETKRIRVPAGQTQAVISSPGNFIKVRAVPRVGLPGFFSSTLNIETGLATVNTIAAGAVSRLVVDEINEPEFSPPFLYVQENAAFEDSAEYGEAVVTTQVDDIVIPTVLVNFLYANDTNQGGATEDVVSKLVIEFLRDDEVLDTGLWTALVDNPLAGDPVEEPVSELPLAQVTSGFILPDLPPAGTHKYSLRYTATLAPIFDNSTNLYIKFVRQLIDLFIFSK